MGKIIAEKFHKNVILTKRNNTYVRIDFHSAQDGVTEIGFTIHLKEWKELDKIYEKNVLRA